MAFSSSGSPLSLVQYVSDTVAIGKSSCPSVSEVERSAVFVKDTVGETDNVRFTLATGESVALGWTIVGAPFEGFEDLEADYYLEVKAESTSVVNEAAKAALSQFSFLDAFIKEGKLVVLDRNGDAAVWDDRVHIIKSQISVKIATQILPRGYRRGEIWAKCPYLRIVDVWIDGSDDTHHNLTLLVKADLGRLGEDADNVEFPDDLAGDGQTVDYPYFGEAEAITWEFEVSNPDGYQRAPSCTPHPTRPGALLISEREVSVGGVMKVSRTYHEVGPTSEQVKTGYEVSYEDAQGVSQTSGERFPIVKLSLEVKLNDYVPLFCGSDCPVAGDTGCGENAELDFSFLKLIEPPVFEPQNTVYGRLTAVYGTLPGYVSTDTVEDNRFGSVTEYTQRVPRDATLPQKGDESPASSGNYIIDVRVTEDNSCALTVAWRVAAMPTCGKVGHEFNPETGELEPFYEFIIPASDVPNTIRFLNNGGEVVEVAVTGGDARAAGDFTKMNETTWVNLVGVTITWNGTLWTMGFTSFPLFSVNGTGGDGSSPATAGWAGYLVTDVEASPVGSLNAEGFYGYDTPIDCHFSLIRKRKAAPFISRSYQTYQNYSWPAVLDFVEMMDWDRRDGGTEIRPRVQWLRYAYSGPCRALVVESWSSSQMALDTVEVMRPLPVSYSCPAYQISIPASLHSDLAFRCDFGSNHSVYEENVGSERVFLATTDVDWPTSLVVTSVQRPYRGGFLKRTITVYPPL